MGNGNSSLRAYLQHYFTNAGATSMQPIIVLDTSAIIDLERAYQKKVGLKTAHKFIDDLLECISPTPLLVIPDGIKDEVESHRDFSINGRPEISESTIDTIIGLPSCDLNTGGFQESCRPLIDEHRLFLRHLFNAKVQGKKESRDPISRNDWEVIDAAVALGLLGEYIFEMNKSIPYTRSPFERCPKVALLSSDSHILGTLDLLFNEPEGVNLANYVRSVNVRSYKLTE